MNFPVVSRLTNNLDRRFQQWTILVLMIGIGYVLQVIVYELWCIMSSYNTPSWRKLPRQCGVLCYAMSVVVDCGGWTRYNCVRNCCWPSSPHHSSGLSREPTEYRRVLDNSKYLIYKVDDWWGPINYGLL